MELTNGTSPCSACQPKRTWPEFVDLLGKGGVGITIYRCKRPFHYVKAPFGRLPSETLVFYMTKSVAWRSEETSADLFAASELPKCAKYCPRCKELLHRIELLYKESSVAEREVGLSELFSCPPCTDIVHKFRKFSQEAAVTEVDSDLILLSRRTSPHSPRFDAFAKARRSEHKTKTESLQTNEVAGIKAIKESVFGKIKRGNEDTMKEDLPTERAAATRSEKYKVQKKTGKGSDTELKQESSELLKSKTTPKDKIIKNSSNTARINKIGEDQDKENKRHYGTYQKYGKSKDSKYVDGKGSKRGERKASENKKYDDGRDSKQVESKAGKRGEGKDSKPVNGKDNKLDDAKDGKHVDGKSGKRGDTRRGDGRDKTLEDERDRKHVDNKGRKLGGDIDTKNVDDKKNKHGDRRDSKPGKEGKARKGVSESPLSIKGSLTKTKSKRVLSSKSKSTIKIGNKKPVKEEAFDNKKTMIRLKIQERMRKQLAEDEKRIDKSRKDIDIKMQNVEKAEEAARKARALAEESRQKKFKTALELVEKDGAGSEDGLTEVCSEESADHRVIRGEKICKALKTQVVENEGRFVRLHTCIDLRHPALAFKQPATVDDLSDTILTSPSHPRATSGRISSPIRYRRAVTRYCLSELKYVHRGWTQLPKEIVMRKIVVFRMQPAPNDFGWYAVNRQKGRMEYDSGQLMSTYVENEGTKLYYRNGELAMEMYHAEDRSAYGQRVVIYSTSRQDGRRLLPQTVLAVFDYGGNGTIFDHIGQTRLKYTQNDGEVVDREIGPHSHWKWHNLNDPTELHTVLVENQLIYKDPKILKLGERLEPEIPTELTPDENAMRDIESQNIRRERMRLVKKYSPYQIKMKAFKLSEYFSLRIVDQSSVFLAFSDGKARLKVNLGMILDPMEIIGEDFVQLGDFVQNNVEKPASSESLERLQRVVYGARRAERARMLKEKGCIIKR